MMFGVPCMRGLLAVMHGPFVLLLPNLHRHRDLPVGATKGVVGVVRDAGDGCFCHTRHLPSRTIRPTPASSRCLAPLVAGTLPSGRGAAVLPSLAPAMPPAKDHTSEAGQTAGPATTLPRPRGLPPEVEPCSPRALYLSHQASLRERRPTGNMTFYVRQHEGNSNRHPR